MLACATSNQRPLISPCLVTLKSSHMSRTQMSRLSLPEPLSCLLDTKVRLSSGYHQLTVMKTARLLPATPSLNLFLCLSVSISANGTAVHPVTQARTRKHPNAYLLTTHSQSISNRRGIHLQPAPTTALFKLFPLWPP